MKINLNFHKSCSSLTCRRVYKLLLKIRGQFIGHEIILWSLGHFAQRVFLVYILSLLDRLSTHHIHNLKSDFTRMLRFRLNFDEFTNCADGESRIPSIIILIILFPWIENRTITETGDPKRRHVTHEDCAASANLYTGVIVRVNVYSISWTVQLKPLLVLSLVSETYSWLCRMKPRLTIASSWPTRAALSHQ